MSQTSPTPNQRMVTELKVAANLMLLDPGLFCIFHTPGGQPSDPTTGLPGVRISRPPTIPHDALEISTFNADGWLGGEGNAALVRVSKGPCQVLVTIYQAANSGQDAPKLQVLRLSDTVRPAVAAPAAAAPRNEKVLAPTEKQEVAAHIQRRGDVLARLGDWMGERGSQRWIEGFAISPSKLVDPADLEYQAVLGKGWLSPWSEGGQYCGSRGMALPILGLRVRLKGEAAERHSIKVSATFTDGTAIGPVDGTETAESSSLAPLEAFHVEIVPNARASEEVSRPAKGKAAASRQAPEKPAPAKSEVAKAPTRPVRAAEAPVRGKSSAKSAPAPAPVRPVASRAARKGSVSKGRR